MNTHDIKTPPQRIGRMLYTWLLLLAVGARGGGTGDGVQLPRRRRRPPPLHSKPPVPLANLPVPQGPAEGRRGLRRLRARLAAPHGDHARGEASVMIMRWNGCVSKIKSVRGDRPSFWGRQDLF